jgi:hypothetical protein
VTKELEQFDLVAADVIKVEFRDKQVVLWKRPFVEIERRGKPYSLNVITIPLATDADFVAINEYVHQLKHSD